MPSPRASGRARPCSPRTGRRGGGPGSRSCGSRSRATGGRDRRLQRGTPGRRTRSSARAQRVPRRRPADARRGHHAARGGCSSPTAAPLYVAARRQADRRSARGRTRRGRPRAVRRRHGGQDARRDRARRRRPLEAAGGRRRCSVPRWAPDGTHIAYRSGGNLRIVYGNGQHDVLAGRRMAAVAPAWRPSDRAHARVGGDRRHGHGRGRRHGEGPVELQGRPGPPARVVGRRAHAADRRRAQRDDPRPRRRRAPARLGVPGRGSSPRRSPARRPARPRGVRRQAAPP